MTTWAERVRAALAADVVEHRHNHTGVGKLSFAVARGSDRLWARVASDSDEDAALRRWAAHADRLALYAAPPVLDVLTIDGRATLVLPLLHEVSRPVPADEVLAVLRRLHADTELAAALGPPVTSREAFTRVWLRRLRADLAIVRGHVPDEVFGWMEAEVTALARLIDGPDFDEVVHAPVHGDPWHENVLATADRWWLIDWEDLAVGDPVIDEAIAAPGTGATVRHRVAHRAVMLDAAVDTAADWVENTDPAIRDQKHRAHLRAVDDFRALWP